MLLCRRLGGYDLQLQEGIIVEFFRRAGRIVNSGKSRLLLALSALLLSGCAATTTFTAYPSKINPLLNTVQAKQPIDLNACLLSECRSKDGILYDMERGRLAQILGNVDLSMQDFNAAMDRIKQNDEKAKISLSNISANLAAGALNDNAIPYGGAGYERVMLHHYQALNYLNKKDLEGAAVEVRRANVEQEDALKRHEEEIEEAQQRAEERHATALTENPAINTVYAQMDEVAGKVKNSFQNAYTFYLSGYIWEAMQQPNDAYIDYRKALEIYPDNTNLQKDVLRLASELNMTDDLEALKARFAVTPASLPSGSAEVLVLFEDGFVPQKKEVKIALPVPKVGLMTVAFPVYNDGWTPPRTLNVDEDGTLLGSTEPICDFRALSVKALKEQVPVIATRQAVRLLAKGATTKLAREKLGAVGELGMSLFNLIGESADLRSWISLPANAQVLRVALPSGTHRLNIVVDGETTPTTVELNAAPGTKNILRVVRTGHQLYSAFLPLVQENSAKIAADTTAQ